MQRLSLNRSLTKHGHDQVVTIENTVHSGVES